MKTKKLEGDTYLVMARFAMDDVPVRLCKSYDLAKSVAKTLTYKDACHLAHNVMGTDASQFVTTAIVAFKDSLPVGLEIVEQTPKEPAHA